MEEFACLFRKVFLDTNIVHYLVKYSDEIFDSADSKDPKILKVINAQENIKALRYLFGPIRAVLPVVISRNVLDEIARKNNSEYSQYAFELFDYCFVLNPNDEEYLQYGLKNQHILEEFETKFGFLSNSDKALIFDALKLRCHYFMTTDLKLLKNKNQIKKFTGLVMLKPIEYWNLLKPWAGLWL